VGAAGGILANLAANVLFWGGLGLVVALASRRRTKAFRAFFGLDRASTLNLFLSNADAAAQDPRRMIVSGHEIRSIQTLSELLAQPFLRAPDMVRGLVDGFFLGSRIRLHVEVSPRDATTVAATAVVAVGGAPRNTVRQRYVDTRQLLLTTADESTGVVAQQPITDDTYVEIVRGERAGEQIARRSNYAIVERLVDNDRGRCAIFCAGARADSSWLAVEWLTRHWLDLHRRFGDGQFAVCLVFPVPTTGDPFLQAYVEPQQLLELRG
jgi:hypothetical protein